MGAQAVREGVYVDPSLAPVAIPPPILNEIYAHARETLPEECCGLVVGREPRRYTRVVRCRNEMTQLHRRNPAEYPQDGRAAYFMSPEDYLRTRDEAEASGEAVTAVYHSHVDGETFLSPMDLAYAAHDLFPFRGADQIVVTVSRLDGGQRGVAVFRSDGAEGAFRGRRVVVADP